MALQTSTARVKSATGGLAQHETIIDQGGAIAGLKPTLLKWIDAFETGDAEIDLLHRNLVKDYNDLLTLLAHKAAWPSVVAQTKKLILDCIEHFRLEEVILQHNGFPRCESHAAQHRRMEGGLRALLARMENFDGSLAEHRDLPASLGPVIVDLMIRHDLDYRSHLLHQRGR